MYFYFSLQGLIEKQIDMGSLLKYYYHLFIHSHNKLNLFLWFQKNGSDYMLDPYEPVKLKSVVMEPLYQETQTMWCFHSQYYNQRLWQWTRNFNRKLSTVGGNW